MDLLKSIDGLPPIAASRADASRIAEEMVDENGFFKDEEWNARVMFVAAYKTRL